MFKGLKENQLLVLLSLDDETFLNQYKQFDNHYFQHRLKQLLKSNTPSKSLRQASLLNKGIFIGSIPVDVAWILISLGVVITSPWLVLVAGLAVFISLILGYDAVFSASAERESREKKILTKRVIAEMRNQLVEELQQSAKNKLTQELKQWREEKGVPALSFSPKQCNNIKIELSHHLCRQEYKKGSLVPQAVNSSPAKTSVSRFAPSFLTFAITSTLLTTFFWGSVDILGAMGMVGISSALLGPLGLLVAGVFAASIAIYLGYQRYCYDKHIATMKNDLNQLTHQQQTNLHDYHRDNRLYKRLKNIRCSDLPADKAMAIEQFNLFKRKNKAGQLQLGEQRVRPPEAVKQSYAGLKPK